MNSSVHGLKVEVHFSNLTNKERRVKDERENKWARERKWRAPRFSRQTVSQSPFSFKKQPFSYKPNSLLDLLISLILSVLVGVSIHGVGTELASDAQPAPPGRAVVVVFGGGAAGRDGGFGRGGHPRGTPLHPHLPRGPGVHGPLRLAVPVPPPRRRGRRRRPRPLQQQGPQEEGDPRAPGRRLRLQRRKIHRLCHLPDGVPPRRADQGLAPVRPLLPPKLYRHLAFLSLFLPLLPAHPRRQAGFAAAVGRPEVRAVWVAG